MKIAMFMLFFVCNMFTVLIMRFAYESNYRYNNGMLIGVHIPGDHVNDDDVTRLMTRFKKSMKYFQNINAVLSIAICFLNFVNIIIFVIMYTIWILVFVFGIMYIQLSAHRITHSVYLLYSNLPASLNQPELRHQQTVEYTEYIYHHIYLHILALKCLNHI